MPEVIDDNLRGYGKLCVNGVFFVEVDEATERAKSEAITEQAEELELCKAELRAYRRAMGRMTPFAQVRAALEVVGVSDEDGEKVIAAWQKIQELV